MIRNFLNKNCYLVGGALRDFLIGVKTIKDIDFVCVCNEEEFKDLINKFSSKHPTFPLDEERYIWRVSLDKGLTVDISKADDIYFDLIRRDFTINSLALRVDDLSLKIDKGFFRINFNKNKLIDITGFGLIDIKKKIIRKVSDEIFDNDPLRIIRAARFVSQFNFKIEPKTKKMILNKNDLVKYIAKERIKEEFIKMALSNNFSAGIKTLWDLETIFYLIPEFEKQLNCAEVYYGKGGVLKHTLNVLEKLDIFFENPSKYSHIPKKLYNKLYSEMYLIKIAGLFHDIAKPHTAKIKGDRLRFFGHENLGAEITQKILNDLKFSNKDINYISTLIKNHLRIGSIACNDPITKKAINRLFYELNDHILGLLVLSWADYASHINNKKLDEIINETKEHPLPIKRKLPSTGLIKTKRFMQVVNFLFKNYTRFSKNFDIKPLLNGNEIMKILSISPGPIVGKIKKKMINMQLEGKITDKEMAISYVKLLHKSLL